MPAEQQFSELPIAVASSKIKRSLTEEESDAYDADPEDDM
jgi:hypothetical protein